MGCNGVQWDAVGVQWGTGSRVQLGGVKRTSEKASPCPALSPPPKKKTKHFAPGAAMEMGIGVGGHPTASARAPPPPGTAGGVLGYVTRGVSPPHEGQGEHSSV